jgi:hypothetical protein
MMKKESEKVSGNNSYKIMRYCLAVVAFIFGMWTLVGVACCGAGNVTNDYDLVRFGEKITEPLIWTVAGLFVIFVTVIIIVITFKILRDE